MPKYQVYVESTVPRIYTAKLVIEAENKEEAKQEATRMYDKDEIDWDDVDTNYDGAEMEILSVSEIE